MWYNATDTQRNGNRLKCGFGEQCTMAENTVRDQSRCCDAHLPIAFPYPLHALHENVEPGFATDHWFLLGLLGLEGGNDEHM